MFSSINSNIIYYRIQNACLCLYLTLHSFSVCYYTNCPGCSVKCRESPLDLVFVIDTFEKVAPENFELVKAFLNALIDQMLVSSEGSQMGLVLYSVGVISLQQQSSQNELKTAVKNMSYLREGTSTGSAIHRATQMFKASRPGVRKAAVVLTDGQAGLLDDMPLEQTVAEAHAMGLELFVIGVINKTDPLYNKFQTRVDIIASDPDEEHIFLIDDFKKLPSKQTHHITHTVTLNMFREAATYGVIIDLYTASVWMM